MPKRSAPIHYVCTLEEARKLIGKHDRFWVSNCGCREERGNRCKQGRMDVCLQFAAESAASGSQKRQVPRQDVEKLLKHATDQFLVPRPFRDEASRSATEGICFCCDDCCYYFKNPDGEPCDKGAFIEKTDMAACTVCGACIDVCYFGARTLERRELAVDRYRCHGCGVCRASCPEECITMVKRAAGR
ncbi:MAG: hypothetical protein HY897_18320 [Deltaproteobacteria bacterium]|nr:hypothetical protein [Deltaproteobacteria bacterium]